MIEAEIDFEGQKLADKLIKIIIWICGLIGWCLALYLGDYRVTIAGVGVGAVIAGLVCLPPWPMFRRQSFSWLKPEEKETTEKKKEKSHSSKSKGGKEDKKKKK